MKYQPHIRIALAGIVLLIILSCTESARDRETMLASIENLETEITILFQENSQSELLVDRTVRLRDAYLDYANTFSGDSLAAEFLFQAAMVDADLHNDVRSGIKYLEQLVEEYPDHNLTPKTLFMIGFTYAEQLNDYRKARDAYNRYLDKYPEGEMAESVRFELETLGMRPLLD
jgi:tetratricopeptide (TPR) repeat protein